ncbi:MAG: DUF1592 domain-containing protein [Deltaproteobacteria bacterium]|nr:DUF1592 domain-containing protein [Deltaproteobacteria bacterium]
MKLSRSRARTVGGASRQPVAFMLVGFCLAACTGSVGSDIDGAEPSGQGGSGKGGSAGSQGGAEGPVSQSPSDYNKSSELRRLTRAEYTNTIFDLLGVDVSKDDRPKELIIQGYSEIAGAQKLGYEDSNAFLNLGDKVAAATATKLDADMKCADKACLRTWASGFLLRAFREPPSDALVDRYAAILSAADAGGTQVERVTAFVSAVLSSPHFLYRKELGATAVSGDASVRAMNPYHVASRLSYMVWQSMPDAQLFAAADKKTLLDPAARKSELTRMLMDPRARKGLRAFVADWMGVFENNLGKKAPAVLMGTSADLPTVAAKAFDMLVDEVLTTASSPKFSDLLKTDQAFANENLGAVLGVTVTGTDLKKVTVPAKDRLGVLTNPMVIGAHSKESGASPFPIGKFVYENVLCESIPPPPASFPPVEDNATGQTLRQKLESMTANEPCLSCHKRIGPPGFSFLPFDPVGRFKNTDAKGQPFDTTGTLLFEDDAKMPFTSAADLGSKLASRPEAQKCIARRLFRWTFGRFEADGDAGAVSSFEKAAVDSSSGVAETLQQIVAAPSFTQVRVR